jgi:tetratricopeptide (TPR) repeat protein
MPAVSQQRALPVFFALPCVSIGSRHEGTYSLGAHAQARYNTRFHPMAQTQKSRREMLEQFIAEKPSDAFARYGLALECVKLGDDAAATQHFQKLLETHPEYVAGYYQFGQLLARLGRQDEARKLLSDGILVAQKSGDMHARDEMQAALTLLR